MGTEYRRRDPRQGHRPPGFARPRSQCDGLARPRDSLSFQMNRYIEMEDLLKP